MASGSGDWAKWGAQQAPEPPLQQGALLQMLANQRERATPPPPPPGAAEDIVEVYTPGATGATSSLALFAQPVPARYQQIVAAFRRAGAAPEDHYCIQKIMNCDPSGKLGYLMPTGNSLEKGYWGTNGNFRTWAMTTPCLQDGGTCYACVSQGDKMLKNCQECGQYMQDGVFKSTGRCYWCSIVKTVGFEAYHCECMATVQKVLPPTLEELANMRRSDNDPVWLLQTCYTKAQLAEQRRELGRQVAMSQQRQQAALTCFGSEENASALQNVASGSFVRSPSVPASMAPNLSTPIITTSNPWDLPGMGAPFVRRPPPPPPPSAPEPEIPPPPRGRPPAEAPMWGPPAAAFPALGTPAPWTPRGLAVPRKTAPQAPPAAKAPLASAPRPKSPPAKAPPASAPRPKSPPAKSPPPTSPVVPAQDAAASAQDASASAAERARLMNEIGLTLELGLDQEIADRERDREMTSRQEMASADRERDGRLESLENERREAEMERHMADHCRLNADSEGQQVSQAETVPQTRRRRTTLAGSATRQISQKVNRDADSKTGDDTAASRPASRGNRRESTPGARREGRWKNVAAGPLLAWVKRSESPAGQGSDASASAKDASASAKDASASAKDASASNPGDQSEQQQVILDFIKLCFAASEERAIARDLEQQELIARLNVRLERYENRQTDMFAEQQAIIAQLKKMRGTMDQMLDFMARQAAGSGAGSRADEEGDEEEEAEEEDDEGDYEER